MDRKWIECYKECRIERRLVNSALRQALTEPIQHRIEWVEEQFKHYSLIHQTLIDSM